MQGPEARAVARAPEWVFRGGDVTGDEGLWFDDDEDDFDDEDNDSDSDDDFGDDGGWDDEDLDD